MMKHVAPASYSYFLQQQLPSTRIKHPPCKPKEKHRNLRNNRALSILAIKELHTYIAKSKINRVQLALHRGLSYLVGL